jgi:hypothetical protein
MSPTPSSSERATSAEVVDVASLVDVAARVTDAVPAGSPEGWRRATFRAVLAAVVRDRVDNRTGDLEDGDVSSLSEFVESAAAAASTAPAEHREDAYEILLLALLEDWVDNWEGTEEEEDEDDDD